MRPIAPLIVLLLLATTAPAQESAAEWVAKLGSGAYAERERAAQALEKMGKAALPDLRDALNHADLETKRRAALLVERIEARILFEEVSKPTALRFQLADMPADDALREIAKQTGLRCGGDLGEHRIKKLDTGTLPFWQAWRQFCTLAKLEETDYARSAAKLRRIYEDDAQYQRALALSREFDHSGRFPTPRLELVPATTNAGYAVDDRHGVRMRVKWHGLDKSIDAGKWHAVFAVEVRAEPRLEIAWFPRVEIVKIVDAQGKERPVRAAWLYPEATNAETAGFLAAYVGEIQHGGLLHLKALEWNGSPCTLKELHGRVRMEVSMRPPLIEIPHLLKAVGKEARGPHGIALKVLEAEKGNDGELHVRLYLDDLESLTPRTPQEQVVRVRPGVVALRGTMDVAIDRLGLLDQSGRRHAPIKSRYEQAAKGKGYEAELVFAMPGHSTDEWTLVLTKAPRLAPVELPFVVRDVRWMPPKE